MSIPKKKNSQLYNIQTAFFKTKNVTLNTLL